MARTDIVAELVSQQELAEDIFLLRVRAPEIANRAVPGQFCMLHAGCCKEIHDPLLRRPLSIHNVKTIEGVVEFLYRRTGRGTLLLSALKKNDPIRILGPLGNGFRWERTGTNILVGGGMGIAPLLFLVSVMKTADVNYRVVLGAASASELVQRDLFAEAAGADSLLFATEDGSLGHKGFVTEPLEMLLKERVSHGDKGLVLTCGPFPMMRAVAAIARKYGAACQVSLEAHMACGSGLCMGCAVPCADSAAGYLHVCREGPVVDAEMVKW